MIQTRAIQRWIFGLSSTSKWTYEQASIINNTKTRHVQMLPWQMNPSRCGSMRRHNHASTSKCCTTRCSQGLGKWRKTRAPGHVKTSGKNWKFPEAAMEHIHWDALKKALANSTQRWILKHSPGQCGVGRMLQRRKYQEHSLCPRCGEWSTKQPSMSFSAKQLMHDNARRRK